MSAPSIAIVVAMEGRPRVELRVVDAEMVTMLDWLRQEHVAAALHELVALLSGEDTAT